MNTDLKTTSQDSQFSGFCELLGIAAWLAVWESLLWAVCHCPAFVHVANCLRSRKGKATRKCSNKTLVHFAHWAAFFFYHKHPNAAGFSTGGSSFSIILTLTTSDYPKMPKYREILVPSTQEQLRKTTAKEESARTVLLQSHQAEQWISAEHVRTTASPPSERCFSGTQQQDLTQRNT